MPRLLRYLLIWLSCTAASVTAVMLTVYFVIGLTRPTPPAARSVQAVYPSPSVLVGVPASSVATAPKAPTTPPTSPSSPPPTTRTPSASPSPTATRAPVTPAPRPSAPKCSGGPGLHTVPSEGGKVTVQYGRDSVCFVSAVPDPGFRTSTGQSDPGTLVVVFTSDDHRSQITATVVPKAQASVRETRL
ncbi:hypothetical protein [Streptomyces sp. NPDC056399]|uniref:hypothetical protein n=1 Tax=Streptomyces sp. NPDC056399 TaxID=3345807 RepID=UPI0035DB40BD